MLQFEHKDVKIIIPLINKYQTVSIASFGRVLEKKNPQVLSNLFETRAETWNCDQNNC